MKLLSTSTNYLFQKNTTFDQDATMDFLARANLPRISETIAEMIDAKFTSEEFLIWVLHDFQTNKKGKSTGEDGLPVPISTLMRHFDQFSLPF